MTKEKILNDIDFRFKVSGNLIKRLGEESISNKNIAILELIKNSHDAKAAKIDIQLNELGTSNASIVISDNGDGMSESDLNDKWLNIATPNKAKKKVPKGGRVPVGEKGIGRLSAESLGHKATLKTMPKGESAGFKIIFDWDKYQRENVLITDVKNPGYKIQKAKNVSGTTLEISELKHDWNDLEAQKSLLRDLYLLNPPNKKLKGFSITTNIQKNITDLKKIKDAFFDKAAYSLSAELTSGNVLKYQIKTFNGKTIKGKKEIDGRLTCGNAKFEFYYYYRQAYAIKNALKVDISSVEIKEINNTLDNYSGIKIYRDNFRVKPYGEPNNDWLGLDLEAINNPSIRPRNNNVFGMVHITKEYNPKISDTTTREGIIHTPEFLDLMSFVKTAIQIFVEHRKEVESEKKKAKKKAAKKITKTKTAPIPAVSPVPSHPKPTPLINVKGEYPQNFYTTLEREINNCFEANYPNAAFFLSRKLVENLIFNILEKKFPSDVNLWYNTSTNNHHKLSLLISNLYSKKASFKPNVQTYIEKFNTEIGKFRKEANKKAHSIFEYLDDRSALAKFRINDLVQLLLNIYTHM